MTELLSLTIACLACAAVALLALAVLGVPPQLALAGDGHKRMCLLLLNWFRDWGKEESKRSRGRSGRLLLESLEDRTLMTVSATYNYINTWVYISSNTPGDAVTISRGGPSNALMVNGQALTVYSVAGISVDLTGGNHYVTLVDPETFVSGPVQSIYVTNYNGSNNSLWLVEHAVIVTDFTSTRVGVSAYGYATPTGVAYTNVQSVGIYAPDNLAHVFQVSSAPNPGTQYTVIGGPGADVLRLVDPNTSAVLVNATPWSSGSGYWAYSNNSYVSYQNMELLDIAGLHSNMRDTAFLSQVYGDLLGRNIDAYGFRVYSAHLTEGWTRTMVARNILASAEYDGHQVQGYYWQYLGRGPSVAEYNYCINLLQSGWTLEQLQAEFLKSDEYYNHQGGNLSSFIAAVYRDAWGRAAQQWEINAQLNWFSSGGSRQAFVTAMLANPQHWQYVITGDYLNYLHRSPSAAELSSWVTTQQQGNLRDEDILSRFVGSDEYYFRLP